MIRRRFCSCVLCAVAAAVAYFMLFGNPPAARAQPVKPVSFINDVAPILKENCFACHDSRKKSGKYDMTTFEKLLEGGSNGEAVVAGKLADSDLHALMTSTDDRRMPPKDKGEPVPKDKAAIVARWIEQGAKLDAGLDAKADLVREMRVRWKPPLPPKTYPFPAIVNALAFTPDSKAVVVGGHHELTVWNAASGKLTERVRMRAERAYGLVFLPDGKLVVAGGRPGQEGDVRVYDISAKGTIEDGVTVLDGVNDPKVLLKALLDVDDSVLALAATPDGKTLAAGGCDRTVRVWDLSDGIASARLAQTVENHADWVLGVALTANGKYLLTAGRDKTAKVWDLKLKESAATIPDHQDIVYGVAAKADGSTGYSVGADKNLRSWKVGSDAKAGKPGPGHTDQVFKVVVSPNGQMLATASADKSVRLWIADSLLAGKTLSGLTDYAYTVAFSPDGQLVAAGSYDGEVRVWKVSDGTVVKGFNASPGYVAKVVTAPEKK